MNDIYRNWLIDCVENRKWSWPRIAFCLINTARASGMSRKELLDELKQDYKLARIATPLFPVCDNLRHINRGTSGNCEQHG